MLQIQFEIFDLQNEKYNINMNFNPQDKQTFGKEMTPVINNKQH